MTDYMATQSIPHAQTISHREVVDTLYTRLARRESNLIREQIGEATIQTLRGQNARQVLASLRRGRYLDRPISRRVGTGRVSLESLPTNLTNQTDKRSNSQIEARDLCDRVVSQLDPIDRAICDGLSRGMTLGEIGCQFGVTRQAVSLRLNKIREKFRIALDS